MLLAACSATKVGYNNADRLLVHSLDSYFQLDAAQETLVRGRVRELLAWHRATQLDQYAAFLEDTQRALDRPLTPDEVLAMYDAINQKLFSVGERAAPELARLALTLRPTQIDHLAEKLAKDASKARRELLRPVGQDMLDQRVENYTERAETWLGTLSEAQRALVRRSLAAQPPLWWADERERRQRDLVAVLRQICDAHPTEAEATDRLRGYFAELRLPADAERRASVLDFRRTHAVLMAQLLNSASPAQKVTLAKKLRSYADDFSALAANGGRDAADW